MTKQLVIFGFVAVLFMVFSAFEASKDTFTVNHTESELKWTGYHLAKSYEHWGYVQLKSGTLNVTDGIITSGQFIIDMNSISNKDVEKEKENTKLVSHLKSNDFFAVKKFPEAKLVINKSDASGKSTGDLTIRGITKEVEFQTTIQESSSDKVVAVADIKVDRTDFKVMYGWKVENAILSNEFRMQVKIVAKK
ncbi:YceI family protein [Fulvivirga sp. M361]|uniref:YceI family protein n=1 Tax=Fulvivirga sp. M361 TaxID=2594266 RepID=UPI00117BCB1E|nr:YceI family protein [Fulvivirga sp. M361]TRX62157.1 YceI family protein [Fulvivirga sp. M361]